IGLRIRRRRLVQHVRWDYAFGEIVDPLETASPRRRGDVPCPEQPFEPALGIAPLPPARLAAVRLEIRRCEWPLAANALQEGHRLGTLLGRIDAHPAPARLATIGLSHPPPQQRMEIEGQH